MPQTEIDGSLLAYPPLGVSINLTPPMVPTTSVTGRIRHWESQKFRDLNEIRHEGGRCALPFESPSEFHAAIWKLATRHLQRFADG